MSVKPRSKSAYPPKSATQGLYHRGATFSDWRCSKPHDYMNMSLSSNPKDF